MNKKICRLCLQTISENCQEIRQTMESILKLNLDISKDIVMCLECKNTLQVLYSLKSACAGLRERALYLNHLKNDVSLHPAKIEIKNNLIPVTEPKVEIKCSFCTKSAEEESLISLHESKENIFLMEMLEKYIPELNATNFVELLTCKTCLDGIQNVSSFLIKCLEVEEKINKYIEIEGTDDKGHIELQNVQKFIFKPMLKFEGESCHINELEQICGGIQEGFTMKPETEVKCEIELDNLGQFIKTEDVDIKSEESDGDSFYEPLVETILDNHTLLHKSRTETKMFRCELCQFETKHRYSIKTHMLTHKSSSEVTMFKCKMCTYETKHKSNLIPHNLIHKSFSEVTMVKCGMCEFETKRKQGLKRHILYVHSLVEKLYKCNICTYETKDSSCFRKHKLCHKDLSKTTKFKCGLCRLEVKRKGVLIRHMSRFHKIPAETAMYKCGSCTFETKRKYDLKRHERTHKNASVFKCEKCKYETNCERGIKRHNLTHKDSSEVTVAKCKLCQFDSKHSRDLKSHMSLVHPESLYKCDTCTFVTRRKYSLKEHKLVHIDPSEATMFKCEMCGFEAKYKSNLRRHILTHKYPSGATVHRCEMCPFKTRYKVSIKRHMLEHKHPSGNSDSR